ncbi:MAG: threonylcarbamoyl-AMP synthase [Nitrosomonas sp. PRO4]|nr:threonylcarbamoyl-AMP synthase [Nitrosomonas sp. PRO4]
MKQTQYARNKSELTPEQQEHVITAARILNHGGTVAFPTETVYGLGADVNNAIAVRKIYDIKQRPLDHPLIVHIGDISQLNYWAQAIPEAAWKLAYTFWPGPLTLILHRSQQVPDSVTGGQNTVGIRMPAHPIALALLDELGSGKALAAPSANRFGRISPTTALHVQQELGERVDMILEGGACEVGLESTIVCFDKQSVKILRPGGITCPELEMALDIPVNLATTTNQTMRFSGMLPAHYAPITPLRIYPTEQIWQQAITLTTQKFRILIMTWSKADKPQFSDHIIGHCAMPADPIAYGKQLYAKLRQFDEEAFDYLLIESPPNHPSWLAIADRLQRASYHSSNIC